MIAIRLFEAVLNTNQEEAERAQLLKSRVLPIRNKFWGLGHYPINTERIPNYSQLGDVH